MSLHNLRFEETTCTWTNLFTEDELDQIIELCEQYEKSTGIIGTGEGARENVEYRNSKVAWINRNNETNWIFERFDIAVSKLNSKFFGFDIDHLNVLQYTVYEDTGAKYDWHWDCLTGNALNDLNLVIQRKVSAVLQLSHDDEYTGGDLILAPGGNIAAVQKQRGLLTVFPSFVNHKVDDIESGTRRTLVAWFTGPDWR
jgi:PKHD-type hydroxylase